MKCPWFCFNLSRKNFVNANGLLSPVISLYVLRSISCNSKSFSCSFFFNASISRFTSESSPSFSGISSYFRNLESQAIPGLSLFTHFCCNFFGTIVCMLFSYVFLLPTKCSEQTQRSKFESKFFLHIKWSQFFTKYIIVWNNIKQQTISNFEIAVAKRHTSSETTFFRPCVVIWALFFVGWWLLMVFLLFSLCQGALQ